MSLNIMCAICNEFYKATDNVYSTTVCGHLFHQHCLFRWLTRSHTCPQCRLECHQRRVHRVYLNFGERSVLDDEEDEVPSNYLHWTFLEEANRNRVPDGAIKCGSDPEGNDAYVARVYFNDDLLPANFVPARGSALVPWGCRQHSLSSDIELLLDCDSSWVKDKNGQVPENAIVTGYTSDGEDLFTGRAVYEGVLLGGKVHRSHGVLYMPYNGLEVNIKEYEVLVRNEQGKQQSAVVTEAATVEEATVAI